jgi:hypothetical protein
MAKDSERNLHACGTSCGRSVVTDSKAMFSYLSGVVCPFPYPKGFPTAQGERLRPRIGPQARCGAIYFGGAWAGSPRLKASGAYPAPSVALALTAAVDRSRAAELGDERKKTCKSSSGPAHTEHLRASDKEKPRH